MRKPRKGCKERDAAYYDWNDHTDDQDKHFFKTIPDKFAHHFRAQIARSIKLESRSNYTFDVQVAKNLGRLVLQSGWKSFASADDLKMLDFLVFKYDGISRLKVLIFDASGCEKVPPCLVAKNAAHGGGKRGKPTGILSSFHDLPIKSLPTDKKTLKQRGNSRQREDHRANSVPSYILPFGTRLTGVQMKKLKEKVRAIHSAIPMYACVMRKTSISGRNRTMDLSREYADAYLPFEEGTLMLQHHGKGWEVRCRVQESRRRSQRLLKGWKVFSRDNKLQLGDLCLIELLKNQKYAMNVHIIRAK